MWTRNLKGISDKSDIFLACTSFLEVAQMFRYLDFGDLSSASNVDFQSHVPFETCHVDLRFIEWATWVSTDLL